MKNILMAVQPKWLAKILNGEKDVEIRKTIPECLKNGEPITVWLYCTKKQHTELVFRKGEDSGYGFNYDKTIFVKMPEAYWSLPLGYHGKVVAKCVVKKASKIYYAPECFYTKENGYEKEFDYKSAGMNYPQLRDYLGDYFNGKDGYALHLTALTVFDKPMELSAFTHWNIKKWHNETHWIPLTRSPQSWMYVEVGE